MDKYRIRPNKGIHGYKVQHKVLFWWKTIYITGLKKNAIDYVAMVLLKNYTPKIALKI